MSEYLKSKTWESVNVFIHIIVVAAFIHVFINLLLSTFVTVSKYPIKHISIGPVIGTSIRRINIKTNIFNLKIRKISLKIGPKLCLVCQDIEIHLLPKSEEHKLNNKNIEIKPSIFKDIDLSILSEFTISERALKVIKLLVPSSIYIRSTSITNPDSSKTTIDITSLCINKFSDHRLQTEVFLHDIFEHKAKNSIKIVGFELACKIAKKDHKMDVFVLSEWITSLRVSDLHVNIPETFVDKYNKTCTSNPQEAKSTDDVIEKKQINVLMKELIMPYRRFIRSMKVFDIKFENLNFIYKDIVTFKVSSSQVYLESVITSNYGASLELIPRSKHTWGDHEFSFSANTISLDIMKKPTMRIPLINAIITTDIILYLFDISKLNQTKVAFNVNVINPSFSVTVENILDIMKMATKKASEDPTVLVDDSIDLRSDDRNIMISKTYITHLVNAIPSFIFELTISNFNFELQVSPTETIKLKVYDSQMLIRQRNPVIHSNEKQISTIKNTSKILSGNIETQNMNNLLKIIGFNISFMNSGGSLSELIPIYTFERCDIFFSELSANKITTQSTLRHSDFILSDIEVLSRLSEVVTKMRTINVVQSETDSVDAIDRNSKKNQITDIDWSVRLRIKDLSISLLISEHLPRILDPVEAYGFNLTEVARGGVLSLQESIFQASPIENVLKIVEASVQRVMDDINHECTSDDIVKFANCSLTQTVTESIDIVLPKIFFKFDVNLIWLIMFVSSLHNLYKPKMKRKSKKQVLKSGKKNNALSVNISKLIFEVNFPEETPLMFVFRNIRYSSEEILLKIHSISGFVHSVYITQLPVNVSLLTIKDFELNIEDMANKNFNICTSELRLLTEYHFKFYMIVTNIITTFKSYKQLNYSFSDLNAFHRFHPKEEHPINIPCINLKSKKFLIDVEEDPFEQELGLILKIGVLEQRERLHKLEELEQQLSNIRNLVNYNVNSPLSNTHLNNNSLKITEDELNLEEVAKQTLYENFSTSWIARYRKAKLTFHGMPYHVQKYEELGKVYYRYSGKAASTVANLIVEDLDMTLKPPSFDLDKYSEFIHDYGKGIPKDMKYTILILLGIDIKTNLWELILRDYPIPVIRFPDTHTTGDIVFAEKMPGKYSTMTTYVPFVPSAHQKEYMKANSIYGSHVIGTMNSIKTYFNIKTSVTSSSPSSITWGKSLQPGYESLMLWFDFLTKPQMDPSPKLGFWDQFRFLLHGRWRYEFSEQSDLLLNIKGAHDPYKIADDGAGLSFCWSGGTIVQIHGSDTPAEFLKFDSQRFQLSVPDFTAVDKFDKVLMKLDGKVTWKLGLLFEQGDLNHPGEEKRFQPSRPHYDVKLTNPEYVYNREDFDSWSGFRSNFIHMSFGVYSSAIGSNNSFYLAPYSMSHFLKWWNLFDTYTSGPIRQGSLFPHMIQNKNKFGRSLFTIKYQLHLAPLTATHVYRHSTAEDDIGIHSTATFTGLKGRVKCLKIDLHQKRIKLTHTNEKLNRSKPVWKFRMSTGEFDCEGTDIRLISTVFDEASVEKDLALRLGLRCENGQSKNQQHDDKSKKISEWFDFEDYVDLNQVSLESSDPLKIEAMPFMSSPRISYFRKMNDDGYHVPYPFGGEPSHSCLIDKNHPERTQERLASKRGRYIRDQIKAVLDSLEDLNKNIKVNHSDKNLEAKKASLFKELTNLTTRSDIIDEILSDIKISEDIPIPEEENDDKDDISKTESGFQTDFESLLRTNTVNSFVSMRRASTINVKSSYDNRFMIHNVQLRINKRIRDNLFEYASSSFERKSTQFFSTYKSVTIVKELLLNALFKAKTPIAEYGLLENKDFASNEEFIERFDELIRKVPSDNFDSIDSYLFQLISPQVQITSDIEPDTAVLLTATEVETGIIDVMQVMSKSGKTIEMDVNTIVESRYCAVSKDIQVFALFKKDLSRFEGSGFHNNRYGMDEDSGIWAPWMPLEICFDGTLLQDHIILRRRSLFLTYVSPNPLYFSDNDSSTFSSDSKFHIGFPSLIITSSSQQYNSVYNIVGDLLSLDSSLDEKAGKLSKILLADEVRNNLEKLDISVVTNLQKKIHELYYVRAFLKSHDASLFRRTSQDLTLEIQATVLELSVLMTAIKRNYDRLGNEKTNKKVLNWKVGTDELIWELYDENKEPFITIGLGPSSYVRSQTIDGSNSNIVAISTLQIYNQQQKPVYQQLVAPLDDHPRYSKDIPMLEVFWLLGAPVGGISVMEEMIISFQPILFKMDHITADKIMNYLFPKLDLSHLSKNESDSQRKPNSADTSSTSNMRRSTSSEVSYNLISRNRNNSDSNSIRDPIKISTTFLRQTDDSINEMVKRSGTYVNIKSIVIKKMMMSISYKGAHGLLTNVNDLTVKVPNLEYSNKLWSRDDFFAAVKKDVIRIVLQHMGNIIGNKFLLHKKENKNKVAKEISRLLKPDSESINSSSGGSYLHICERYSLPSITKHSSRTNRASDTINSSNADEENEIIPFYPNVNNPQ